MLVTTPAIGARITVSRLASTWESPSRSSESCRSTCCTCERVRRSICGSSMRAAPRSRSTCERCRRSACSLISWSVTSSCFSRRPRGEELLPGELRIAVGLLPGALDPRPLQLHLAVELDELVVQVLDAPPHGLHLLAAQLVPALLLGFEVHAPGLHLLFHRVARGGAGAQAAVERDAGEGIAGLHFLALVDQELGHSAGVGGEHPGGAGIEGEVSLDPLTARVLAPHRDHDEQHRRAGGQKREDPSGDGAGDGRLPEKLLALGVDRLLSE